MFALVKPGIACTVILCASLVQLGSSSKCEGEFRKAEARLASDGNSLDSEHNLAGLKKYADELRSSRVKRLTSSPKRMDDLIKAKEESELPRQKCDMEQYQLMDSVITSIYGKPLGYTQPRDCLIRIDTLFDGILSKYLNECRPIHEKKLRDALPEVDSADREAAELLSATYFTGVRPVEPIPGWTFAVTNANNLLQRNSLLPLRGLNAVYSVIKKASPEAASTMKQMGPKAAAFVAEKLEEFLFSRCDRFLQKLGEVTEISRLDHLTETDDGKKEKLEFYKTIIEGHMCRLAVEQRKKLPKMMAERMWEVK